MKCDTYNLIYALSKEGRKEMKNELKDLFFTAFDPIMTEKGFIRKGKIYHRTLNDKIIQLLSYRTSGGGYAFTIDFAVVPLCLGGDCSDFFDVDSLFGMFRIPEWEFDELFGFRNCVPDALKTTEESLFPLFDAIVDYQSYMQYLPEQSLLAGSFIKDVQLVDFILNRYDECEKSREALMKDWLDMTGNYISDQIARNQKHWGADYSSGPSIRRRFESQCTYYNDMKDAMLANDKEVMKKHIAAREQELLSSYIRYFYGKKKYERYLSTASLLPPI